MTRMLLMSALSVAGLATVLAMIILIAERYLMDYGEADVTINGEKKFTVKGGNTVLNTLKEHKIFIPSACGGRATCAYCKVKAVHGFGEVLATETPLLTREEISENIRLSCQIKIKNDVAIEIPEELFSIREFRARVLEIQDLTYDTKFFRLKLIDPDSIDYKPGQYIQFQTPEYGEISESVYRAYSMAGLYTSNNYIDLMVRLVPEGIATTYMFKYMAVGEEVIFTGPYGDFYLRDTDRKMLCVAGGTGMAPIRAMLLSMSKEEIATREPIFFFGVSSVRDLFMIEEWAQFEREHPGFKFIPALSRLEATDNWEGETGRVTDVIPKFVSDVTNYEAYLCGSPAMLDACVQLLQGMGLPEELIYYDKFV